MRTDRWLCRHRQGVLIATIVLAVLSVCSPAPAFTQDPPSASAGAPQTSSPPLSPEQQELKRLLDKGDEFYDRGDYSATVQCYQDGLKKAQIINDTRWMLQFLNSLGSAYYSQKAFYKALGFYQGCLAIHEQIGEQQGIARSLNKLGIIYRSMRQFDKALDFYQRALAISEQMGNQEGIATNLDDIGNIYYFMRQFYKALDFYQRALAIYEKMGKAEDIAISLDHIGNIYYSLRQFDKALDFFQRAKSLLEKEIERDSKLERPFRRVFANNKYLYAVSALGGRENQQKLAIILDHIGMVCYCQEEFINALDFYQRALTIREQIGSQLDIATDHNITVRDSSNRRVLLNRQKVDNLQDITQSLNILGNFYISQGQFGNSLYFLQRALAISEQIGDQEGIAKDLNNLGYLYSDLGQFDKALDFYQRALAIFEQIGDQVGIATNLNNLGCFYYSLKQFNKALGFNHRALAISEQIGDQEGIAINLNNLGRVYRSMRQFDKALDFYQRALAIFEQMGNQEGIAKSFKYLGDLYYDLGHLDKALNFHQRALAIVEKMGNELDIIYVLRGLGEVYCSLGHFDRAEQYYKQAQEKFESMGKQILEPEHLGAWQDTQPRFYARYADLLLKRKVPQEALIIVECGSAQGLAKQAVRNGVDFSIWLTPKENRQLQEASQQLSATARILRLRSEGKISTNPSQETDYKTALEHYNRLRAILLYRHPGYSSIQGYSPPSFQHFQRLAQKNPDTLFLKYTVVDDNTTLLFALSKRKGLQCFRMPVGEETLQRQADTWRNAILQAMEKKNLTGKNLIQLEHREKQAARTLYRTLFAPLEKAGLVATTGCQTRQSPLPPFTRIVFVADGPLLGLPMAALLDGTDKRLLERYTLSQAVSLGVLTWPANPRKPTRSLLCVADPIGTGGDNRQIAARDKPAPLPHGRKEALGVTEQIPDSFLKTGKFARESDVKTQLSQYAILHFATHGILNNHQGLFSYLLLASEPPTSADDGNLEAREIAGMRLSARLATLSACDTGLGQRSGGEGLLGLAWAFQAAGCPSVVASLWKVNDAATKEQMTSFYGALRAGSRLDDALSASMRHARRKSREAYKADLPYFWAGFVLFGDRSPVSLPRPAKVAAH